MSRYDVDELSIAAKNIGTHEKINRRRYEEVPILPARVKSFAKPAQTSHGVADDKARGGSKLPCQRSEASLEKRLVRRTNRSFQRRPRERPRQFDVAIRRADQAEECLDKRALLLRYLNSRRARREDGLGSGKLAFPAKAESVGYRDRVVFLELLRLRPRNEQLSHGGVSRLIEHLRCDAEEPRDRDAAKGAVSGVLGQLQHSGIVRSGCPAVLIPILGNRSGYRIACAGAPECAA